jgi:hypothetical protein
LSHLDCQATEITPRPLSWTRRRSRQFRSSINGSSVRLAAVRSAPARGPQPAAYRRGQSLSADGDTIDPDHYAMVVAVIVVPARRAPCHASDAAGRQRPSYDGLRSVSGYNDAGSLSRLDRIRHCTKHHSDCADEYSSFRSLDHDCLPNFYETKCATITDDSVFSRSPDSVEAEAAECAALGLATHRLERLISQGRAEACCHSGPANGKGPIET